MIVEGGATIGSLKKARMTYLRMVQNVQLTCHPPKLSQMDDPVISFIEENARWVHHQHDNALVINLTIVDFNT